MKKPTGPGRIEILRVPFGSGIAVLLFNFDFDDDAVKAEHQAWLSEHAVPSLRATDKTVVLRGIASKVGDQQYNLQLSKRRVEAIRNFLVGQGVVSSQIVTSFTGEDLSTSLLADDQRDRAVEAIFESSAGPAAFKRAFPGVMPDGFDEESDPPTLVVGRTPRLINLIGAAGALVQTTNESAVRVSNPLNPGVQPVVANSDRFLLRLEMGIPGEAQIIARMPQAVPGSLDSASLVGVPGRPPSGPLKPLPVGGEKARLNVQSLPELKLNIGFHYVKKSVNAPPNTPAPFGVHANRAQNSALEAEIVGHINRIYNQQTNISFALVNSTIVHNNGVQSPHVDSTGARTDKQGRTDVDLITATGGTGHLQVFFVGRIGGETGDFGAVAPIGDRVVVCQDALTENDQDNSAVTTDALKIGQILAHEFGHCFGEDHPKRGGADLLMFEKARDGERIPIDVATRMRRSAEKKR